MANLTKAEKRIRRDAKIRLRDKQLRIEQLLEDWLIGETENLDGVNQHSGFQMLHADKPMSQTAESTVHRGGNYKKGKFKYPRK